MPLLTVISVMPYSQMGNQEMGMLRVFALALARMATHNP